MKNAVIALYILLFCAFIHAQAQVEEHASEEIAAIVSELADEMVSIPGGSFRMGDLSGEGQDDEKPVRTVTVPVGSFPANAWGLHDMHGNVWEWVQDCWNGGYEGAPTDGSAWTSGECGRRVDRGGSWLNYPGLLRSANHNWNDRSHSDNDIGFRLAQDQ